jgi:starch synthase
MAKVLMVASEATPYVKTGGLADVVGSLPAALRALGDEVAVVLPRYRSAKLDNVRLVWRDHTVWLGPVGYPIDLLVQESGVPYYFVDCPALFDRDGIYTDAGADDFIDNHVRFAVLSRAALHVARHEFQPHILHCHDWQAGLAAVYLRHQLAGDPTFSGMKTLLTIHNLGYQGIFARSALADIGLSDRFFHPARLEFYGNISLLKGGIVWSDAINTVSGKYAEEIQTPEYGHGMDGLLRSRGDVLTGILNGVDYSEWNPETDRYIAANYSVRDLAGKRLCKQDLLTEFGFPAEAIDRPLIGIVSRFAHQKGFDLIEAIAGDLAREEITLVALGTGEPRYELLFQRLAALFPEKVAVRVAYDYTLAHKIEAGADLFLMPSRYEPCGLNQIYSLKYGTVPVVRATGGLDDTIDESTGFKFWEYDGRSMLQAIREALAAWRDRNRWESLIHNGMAKDYSWAASAAEYAALYRRLAV